MDQAKPEHSDVDLTVIGLMYLAAVREECNLLTF